MKNIANSKSKLHSRRKMINIGTGVLGSHLCYKLPYLYNEDNGLKTLHYFDD